MAQHGRSGAVALFLGGCLLHAPPPQETVAEEAFLEEEEGDGEAAGSEDGEDELTDLEMSDYGDEMSDDEEEDDEEEESDGQDSFDVSAQLLQMLHPRKFLGASAPRFAAAGNTAGFMRVVTATTDAENPGGGGGGDRKIINVLYRYTRFSAAEWSDGGVEARGSTRVHQLRFTAAAGLGARSLAWAGASMSPLIYPGGRTSTNRLRKLWSSLIAGVRIPPHATQIKVFVDVGILRPADCALESMEHMCAALEDTMTQPWPGRFVGMELRLPEPVRRGHREDDDGRPAKRSRVVTPAGEDDCGVCREVLEGDDLAAWPGCGKPHVFHGACMESVLENDLACPICRRRLYSEPKF